MNKAQLSEVLPPNSYGQILLSSGTLILGTWVTFTKTQLGNVLDDKGVTWWVDLNEVVAFSPQTPPPPPPPAA